MFTVLIAEKEHIDAIRQDNNLFFEPFLENKELAFCYWNPSGQNFYDSVPELPDIVGRKSEWRAIIINNCKDEFLKSQNPFDVVDHSNISTLTCPAEKPEADEPWEKWEANWKEYYANLATEKEKLFREAIKLPLQKLATWLCFRPTDFVLNEVQEKKDVHDWAMQEIQKNELKPSTILEHLEREQYKHELRLKERIRREFVSENPLNISYPSEIHCITPRTSENVFFDPDTYWNIRNDSDYSAFSDRNMYFDKMRFMAFDLLAKSHRNFRTDYIRFLASILVFASNPLPNSAMRARKLYLLEAQTDDTPLCTLVTSYDKKLAATSEVIENEMEKIRSEIPSELTDKAAEALFCTPKNVAVLLDESCDMDKVLTEKDYGLFFDSPENEFHKWNRNFNTSEKSLAYIVKQQSRSVKKSVDQAKITCEISDVDVSRLTPMQVEDVRNYTDAAENNMVASTPPDLEDITRYTERLDQESEKVKKAISRRMTKKTTLILSVICLALFVICFLPFLFSNNGTPKTVSTAITLCGAMLGVLAISMLVSLFFLRRSVVNAVIAYNNTAREIINEIQASLKSFSNYLSALCNVRRGHVVQQYAQKNVNEYTKSLRIRKKHQEDIRKKRACLVEDYGDYLGDKSFCDETMSRPYDYDFDQATEYTYPAPFLAGDCRQIEFLSSGNFVQVPSSYITRLLVKMEEIYEK